MSVIVTLTAQADPAKVEQVFITNLSVAMAS